MSANAGFRRLLVLLAAIVALAIAVIATRDRFKPKPPPAPPDALEGVEDPVARSLRLAAVDTTRKNEWVEEVPGVDVVALSAAQREVFVRFANAEHCSCGCGFTLAACRSFDSSCEISGPRVEKLRDSVAAGLVHDVHGLRERPALQR